MPATALDEPPPREVPVALLLLGRASLVLASVVSTRAATALLGAGEMGAMNLLLGVIGLPALLVSSFSQYFNRQLMEWRLDRSLGANFGRYLRFLLLAALLAAAGTAAAMAWLGPQAAKAGTPAWAGLLAAGSVAVVSANGALLHLCNLSSRRLGYVVLSNLASWGGLGLALLVCATAGADAVAWMGAVLCAQLATALLAARLAAPEFRPPTVAPAATPRAHDFKPAQVWSFSWPLLMCCGLYWVQRSLALPWLALNGGLEELGHFSVAFSVGMLVMLSFDTWFKEAYAPLYYHATAHADDGVQCAAWNRYARAFVPAVTAAGVCTVAAAQPLLRWLTSEDFRPWASYLAWGVASQWLISVYSLCVLQAATALRNRSLIAPNLAGAAATALMLVVPLDVPAGLRAALATTVGLACTSLAAGVGLARRPGLRWPFGRTLWAAALAAPAFVLAALWRTLSAGEPEGWASLALLAALACLGGGVQLALGRWWLRCPR